jgi:predicted nucleic acid-binding protein
VILVDSNVLMYAAGSDHPFKQPSVAWLERVATGEIDATVDAEVLQEILHRYRSIGRWSEGRQVYDLARALFPVVIPIDADVLDRSREIMDTHSSLMARDALHAAVLVVHDLDAICSYDRDFDVMEELRRIEPSASADQE